MIELGEFDRVLAAFAQRADGPGWANQPIWVLIQDGSTGSIREECIQPENQTPEMQTLYAVSEAAHLAMTGAVQSAISFTRRLK